MPSTFISGNILARILSALPVMLLLGATTANPSQAATRVLCVHGIDAPKSLNVRSAPSQNAPVVLRFPAKGCGVTLAGRCEGEWCIMALGNQSGWVNTRFIAYYDVPDDHQAATALPAAGAPGLTATPRTERIAQASPPEPRIAPRKPVQPHSSAAPRNMPPRTAEWRRVEPRRERLGNLQRYRHDRPDVRGFDVPGRIASAFAMTMRVALGGPIRSLSPPPAREACVTRVDQSDTLRVRRGPGVDNDAIGEIPPHACGIERVGGCMGAWCRIAWRGRMGWVNSYYLQ